VVYAIAHASFVATIEDPGFRGGRVELYIGPEHDQTVRELEILVERFDDGREAVIFHVMSLGPKFTRYREEHSDD
jgi:hypothetical protein